VNSALYEGTVRHRRLGGPLRDEFRHRLFMAYLDLAELPEIFDRGPLWSARRPAPAWFRRADHLGDRHEDLAESVRRLVAERTGQRPEGPIRLLTHLRCFGHCFNPVSFYYCFGPGEDGVEPVTAAIAHVTNTPWGESHSYVLAAPERTDHGSARVIGGSFAKQLHVSPLMGMDHRYQLRLSEPGERLSVHIESTATAAAADDQRPVFDATLSLARREMSSAQIARLLGRYPFLTVSILARIYGHALRLRARGAIYHPHPSGASPA
jgi:uncharacterized protein